MSFVSALELLASFSNPVSAHLPQIHPFMSSESLSGAAACWSRLLFVRGFLEKAWAHRETSHRWSEKERKLSRRRGWISAARRSRSPRGTRSRPERDSASDCVRFPLWPPGAVSGRLQPFAPRAEEEEAAAADRRTQQGAAERDGSAVTKRK